MKRRYSRGQLDAIYQLRTQWRRGQLARLGARMAPSSSGREPHWACRSCGLPCNCQGGARLLPHQDCGRWEW